MTNGAYTRADKGETARAGDDDFHARLDKMSPVFEPVMRRGDDGMMMMFTSGATGLPKGVSVPIKALLNFWVYMVDAVDLRPGDKFWNIADPGWAYGLYYAITGQCHFVNNHHGLDHKVHIGSAGLAMAGFRALVVDAEGKELPPNVPGELAVDIKQSPLFWFGGYRQTADAFHRQRPLSHRRLVEREIEGAISFVGRNDDVITSAGYRIGPFDVESALLEHPAVVETAVVGKPDAERTEIVKAFVVLQEGFASSGELAEELRQYVRKRLSAHAYPREIEFMEHLPRTPSGKLQRFILRNQEKAHAADNAPA